MPKRKRCGIMKHPLSLMAMMVALSLGACSTQSAPMGKPIPNLTFTHLQPYKPYNAAVRIQQSAVLGAQTQEALRYFVIKPDQLIRDYAHGRFLDEAEGIGLPIKTVFDVKSLSLRKKSDADNVVGILSGAAADYYTLLLLVTMSPVQEDGQLSDPYTIKITRELLIPDQASLAEKEIRQFEFMEKVIGDIDRTITTFYPNMI